MLLVADWLFFFLIDTTTVSVLVRSITVFPKSLLNTHFFQFLIFTVFNSLLTSPSHLFFGLPNGLEANGFHLYTVCLKGKFL
jgi:hypothetical protein